MYDEGSSWLAENGLKVVGAIILFGFGFLGGMSFSNKGRTAAAAPANVSTRAWEIDQRMQILADQSRPAQDRLMILRGLKDQMADVEPEKLMQVFLAEKDKSVAKEELALCQVIKGREAFVVARNKAHKLLGTERVHGAQLVSGDVRTGLEMLRKWTYDPSPEVRAASYEAIGSCKTQAAARMLVEATGRETDAGAKVSLARMRTALRAHFDKVDELSYGRKTP